MITISQRRNEVGRSKAISRLSLLIAGDLDEFRDHLDRVDGQAVIACNDMLETRRE